MIFDHIDQADQYNVLGPDFVQAFAFLRNFNPETADGRHDIDGDQLYALVQSTTTKPFADSSFESHKVHVDIHYLVSGKEVIYVTPVSQLSSRGEYIANLDYTLHDGEAEGRIFKTPGSFAIFWPNDGHKPGCHTQSESSIRKVVIKLLLSSQYRAG